VRRARQFAVNDVMDFSGLTDLPERSAQDCARCRCGSLARVASGLCVSCLLRSGLDPNEADIDDFDALLDAVDVPDRDWQLGHYRILEEIGRGGMGVIYRARHAPSRRIVALKRVLNYHSDSRETLARFQREARAAASLDHPNILPIYDVGTTDDGLPFFSMKLASGGSLLDSKESFRDSPRRGVQLITTVSRAVHYAHGRGILHRDLKPGNILLDARGEPMVSDFGLAKWLDTASELTCTLTVFGTPGYIAPEQAANAAADLKPATDVYSLGAVLFELLAGRPPFLGEHAVAVIRQAADNDAPKLRSIVPSAPRDLETICARCLERDPNLRYQSAAALAEDLDRWLEGRPVKARPVSPPARVYRWSRRNPILATSLAICFLFGAAIAARQIQSWKLETKVRENELARNSVAVLPFLDLDSATEESGWTAALAQALQTELSGIGNARVVPVGNGDDVKRAARNFRTRTALFGTRRKINRGMRISVQLFDSDGELLLRQLVDVSAVPSDLKSVTHDLSPAIYSVLTANDWLSLVASKRDPALRNERARNLIVAGRELIERRVVDDIDRAIACFQKVTDMLPESALARAYLASAAATRTHFEYDAKLLQSAELSARDALRLNPDSAEAHRALAGVLYQKGDFANAREEAFRSMESGGPEKHVMALVGDISKMLGQPGTALMWFGRLTQGEKPPAYNFWMIGDCWADLGEDNRAEEAYHRVSEVRPELPEGWLGSCRLRLLQRDFDGARKLAFENHARYLQFSYSEQMTAEVEFFARNFARAADIYRNLIRTNPDGGGSFYGAVSYQSALGRIEAATGRAMEGRRRLSECLAKEIDALGVSPNQPEILYRIAAIESSLGEKFAAVEYLRRAVAAGWVDYRSLALDPRFDAITNHPQFQLVLTNLRKNVGGLRRATLENIFVNEQQLGKTNYEKVEQPRR
jgi:serine/threonine protein kinase/tetratricopeptide (TPR) repeat protein